ncbi:MAG TPA: MAPEG family protein [Stellaceae bacterium]|nr:MAPEG family protein [Stellaceae bacterium]
MTFAHWMIVAAIFLPYASVVLAKSGGVGNHAPRATLGALTGWRQRADWAHRNHFEAFAPFAASVIIAELAHVPQPKIDIAAGAFVALRIAYTALYIADLASLRSIVWSLAFICVLALFVMSA